MEGYGKRILVVEDDEDVRMILCSTLADAGYNSYEACDGMEAVEALKKRRYDVLLTDYHMPKMDGLELLDLAKAMWPELPVILASSDLTFTDQTGNALLDPAYAVLAKPFDRYDLLRVIQAAVSGLPNPSLRPLRSLPHRASPAAAQRSV